MKLTLEYARSRGLTGRSIPTSDLNAVTVPGDLTHGMQKLIVDVGYWVQGQLLPGWIQSNTLEVDLYPSPMS